jgi:hypothetical protein
MARRAPAKRKRPPRARRRQPSWVRKVAETSDAMDLPPGIFRGSPEAIARGLKTAVLRSRRTKARTKFQSAMSMLNLYINRAGRSLPRADRRRLESAKDHLRQIFGRGPSPDDRAARGSGGPRRRVVGR